MIIHKKLLQNKDKLIEHINLKIKIILSQNQIKVDDPFNFGVIFISSFYQDYLFKNSFYDMKVNGVDYFNPIVFSESILNNVTSKIIKEHKFRGFSCSFIKTDNKLINSLFITSNCKYFFIVRLQKILFINYLHIILLEK